jgi:hypothetical protein
MPELLFEKRGTTLFPAASGGVSASVFIMTDDKAPVEMLGIRQIDSIIRDELPYYKEQILSGNFDF